MAIYINFMMYNIIYIKISFTVWLLSPDWILTNLIFSHPFTFNLFLSLYLNYVTCRQRTVRSYIFYTTDKI